MKNIKECGPDWFPLWLKGKVLNCFFKEMCIEHDELYDLGGDETDRYNADWSFWASMKEETAKFGIMKRVLRLITAVSFITWVRLFGWISFNYKEK